MLKDNEYKDPEWFAIGEKKPALRGLFLCEWWAYQGSNLGPSGYEPGALPTEL